MQLPANSGKEKNILSHLDPSQAVSLCGLLMDLRFLLSLNMNPTPKCKSRPLLSYRDRKGTGIKVSGDNCGIEIVAYLTYRKTLRQKARVVELNTYLHN